tara:strand:- start:1259 stop:1405 length:147 start_codon:yes stop_codon:yes gene_type:complete
MKKVKKVVIWTIAIFLYWLATNNSNRRPVLPDLYDNFIEFLEGHKIKD